MKITVISDKNGHILGTYRHPTRVPEGYPRFQIHGGAEHTVHELDMPAGLEQIRSAEEFHRRLNDHMKTSPPKRS